MRKKPSILRNQQRSLPGSTFALSSGVPCLPSFLCYLLCKGSMPSLPFEQLHCIRLGRLPGLGRSCELNDPL